MEDRSTCLGGILHVTGTTGTRTTEDVWRTGSLDAFHSVIFFFCLSILVKRNPIERKAV